ncbi:MULTISPECIES: HD domain-containing protein [unclassified Pseudodesulfovibrio]|uniref:HD domain-containing protein n=1 Tax=unclassified Pseudodesulfovibrio TaxID=2661612 RepID=UPI000FEBBA43|nr:MULTISPECIES: HD domain-containing protein [unclassified Pseudodesulfovibrio]MCJ2164878.1 HD domain-containing protein [Pseudodesulfovibrio sp. S3-i]RWU03754.1 HD domain-containing protein [Pseudodesulfovibrio sp. S3]
MSVIIRKSLLELIFSGAFMKRWNDKLRPMELVEVDKQGHKMIVAWLLFLLNSRDMDVARKRSLGESIIEGGLFDYLYRLVITDIKPPVFYRIKENPEDYKTLSKWVLKQLTPRIMPLGEDFTRRMGEYLMHPEDKGLARRILSAAHLYASYSEFKLLKSINQMDHELIEIEDSFKDRLNGMRELNGVADLLDEDGSVLGRFARMCGRLRFQKRWSQTPRVPETSVLGHMFIVASYSWFFSMEVGACRARSQNNFFSGLFHDLPELLTRDIISPVKGASQEISDLIHEYEIVELNRVVLTPLKEGGFSEIADRLEYLLGLEVGSEFKATVVLDGKIHEATDAQLAGIYNQDTLDPKDGPLLKVSDSIAAYIEAHTALKNGISSGQLHHALYRIQQTYNEKPVIAGVQVSALLADFD